ncbi:8205_t:CDS:2, partial [Scutellospora calospora]
RGKIEVWLLCSGCCECIEVEVRVEKEVLWEELKRSSSSISL